MSANPEVFRLRGPAARILGPAPTLKELNLVCWGVFIAFLVLPLIFVLCSYYASGQQLLKTGESDFIYLYGMGQIFNDYPAEELYDWAVQKQVCTAIRPLEKGEYGPIPYHPFVGILFRPFARLPYLAAFVLWIAVSFTAYVAGIAVLSGWYFRDDAPRRSLIFCFALSFYPFCWTIMTGHLSTLGFLALAAALVQQQRGHHVLAGLALSICVYKPTLLVLILPMLVITRRFRTCIGFAVGSVVLALFATAVQGVGLWSGYVPMLFSFGRGAARVQTHSFKELWKYVDASSFSSAVSSRLPAGISWLALPLLVGFVACVAVCLVWVWWKSAETAKSARSASSLVWAAALTWTLVLNVYAPIYDCLLVVIAAIATAGVLKDVPDSRCRKYFTPVALLIFSSSWVTTDVAERYGVQIITVFIVALGLLQLTALRSLTLGAHPVPLLARYSGRRT